MTTDEYAAIKKLLHGIDEMFSGDVNWKPEDVYGYREVADMVGHDILQDDEAR